MLKFGHTKDSDMLAAPDVLYEATAFDARGRHSLTVAPFATRFRSVRVDAQVLCLVQQQNKATKQTWWVH